MRVAQQKGARGSLKWIQTLVNERPHVLFDALPDPLKARGQIEWLSPTKEDDYAEYRDRKFLKRIGASELVDDLSKFWPAKGPQWDALGRTAKGDILLVEAKAHIDEMCGPPCMASEESLRKINAALAKTADALKAGPKAPWTQTFYQYANRLAHLYFLKTHGKSVWMLFIYFVGDDERGGPKNTDTWESALGVMKYVMGLSKNHLLSSHIVDVYIDVGLLATGHQR